MVFKYFQNPDNPEIPYGPANWARDLWLEDMPLDVRKQLHPATGLPRGHLHHVDICVCMGSAGTGKCHAKSTPILMFDGRIKMVEDVEVGDLLMGPDSRPRAVISLARGREAMYRVTPSKGDSFVCNESHILTVKQSGNKRAGNGSVTRRHGQVFNFPIKDFVLKGKQTQKDYKLYKSDQITFPVQFPLKLDPYFLGVWLGDGNSSDQSITNPEPEIRDYIEKLADELRVKFVARTSSSNCPLLSLVKSHGYLNPVLVEMRSLNLIGNKHIPHEYLTASVENRLQLLAGLLDTDGYYSAGDGYYEISQKNEGLAKQILFLARSLGFRANGKPVKVVCTNSPTRAEGIYWRINISGNLLRIPVKVERKKPTVTTPNKDHLVSGFTLEKLPEDDYYGFEVEGPDRLYLLGDFTVVHNSVNSGSRGMYLARKWKKGRLIIGAMNRPQLDRNQIQYWSQIYGNNGNGMPWGHKSIKRHMTDKRHWVELDNDTWIYFLNFELWQQVQGIPAGFILVEEANNLKSVQSYMALLSRLRCQAMPLWQVILLANPRISGNWMMDTFDLRQFMPTYKGDRKPIGKPCNCQFCPACLAADEREVEWKDDECPRCGITNNRPKKVRYCRNCRSTKKKLVKYDGDVCPECGWFKCPGEQYFVRFIPSTLRDNQFADESMLETMRATMSSVQFALLGEGKILETNTGVINVSWNETDNVLPKNVQMDYDKDINWCQDFNTDPMSTVLCQKYQDGDRTNIVAVDEIITFRSTVQDSVKVFLDRYGDYKGKVIIWGDPSGYSGSIKDKVLDRYEQICQYFDEAGINYELRAVSTPMRVISRLDNLNYHLCDATGYIRLRFNPRCTWTIESVRGVKWNKQGTKEDESEDKRVRELALAGDIPGGVPGPDVPTSPLTHPQAALGYWLNLEFPQVEWAVATAWHREPDGRIIEFRGDEIIEKGPEFGEKVSLEDFNPSKYSLDDIAASVPNYNDEDSLGDHLRSMGLWLN